MSAAVRQSRVHKKSDLTTKPSHRWPRIPNSGGLTGNLKRTLSLALHENSHPIPNESNMPPSMAHMSPMTMCTNQSSGQLYAAGLQHIPGDCSESSLYSTPVLSDGQSEGFSSYYTSNTTGTTPSLGEWVVGQPQEYCDYPPDHTVFDLSTCPELNGVGMWSGEIGQTIDLPFNSTQHPPCLAPINFPHPTPVYAAVNPQPVQHTLVQPAPQPVPHAAKAVKPKEESPERQGKPGSEQESESCDDPSSRLFACPFWKLNSSVYHECSKFELRRFKDVKQHVKRKHMSREESFSCLRCSQASCATESQTRIEQRRYEAILINDQISTVSEDQWSHINSSLYQCKTDLDKWFKMWDILFAGTNRPSSCLMGHCLEEAAPFLRRVWNNNSEKIIRDILNTEFAINCNSSVLRNLAEHLIRHLEVEAERTSPQDSQSTSTTFDGTSRKTSNSDRKLSIEVPSGNSQRQSDDAMEGTDGSSWGNDCLENELRYIDPMDTIKLQDKFGKY